MYHLYHVYQTAYQGLTVLYCYSQEIVAVAEHFVFATHLTAVQLYEERIEHGCTFFPKSAIIRVSIT